ncbi:MAG: hypothetical protein COY80_01550 [Candidatus Pacebacteria bacterium CG_4_10_14_0_8_um_filter_42_14]|nr:MAG: hypothetical protein COY80_01550 [Candidatus Pacebacteria bacterium CG_4_10_14_0_8_um_filter_42_14]
MTLIHELTPITAPLDAQTGEPGEGEIAVLASSLKPGDRFSFLSGLGIPIIQSDGDLTNETRDNRLVYRFTVKNVGRGVLFVEEDGTVVPINKTVFVKKPLAAA